MSCDLTLACVLLTTSVVMWCHVTSLPQVWRQWAYFGEPLENLEWGSSGGSWRWTQVRGSAPRGPNISPEIWNWLRGFMWTFRAMQFSQTIGPSLKIRSTVTFSLQTPAVMEVSGMAFSCTFSLKVQLDRPCFLSDVFAKYIVIVLPSACVVKYLWNSLSPLSLSLSSLLSLLSPLSFSEYCDFEGYSVYDVADLVKQFFRELPEPLLTVRFSELLTSIQDS